MLETSKEEAEEEMRECQGGLKSSIRKEKAREREGGLATLTENAKVSDASPVSFACIDETTLLQVLEEDEDASNSYEDPFSSRLRRQFVRCHSDDLDLR